jgi:ComF family protein
LPIDVIVPVPLHAARLRERGYNQAALLAKHLSIATNIPLVEDGLVRTRATASQMTLKAAERKINVQDAFGCSDGRMARQRVVVIDDVCTTGATLEACAQALFQAGAVSVWALTLARAL